MIRLPSGQPYHPTTAWAIVTLRKPQSGRDRAWGKLVWSRNWDGGCGSVIDRHTPPESAWHFGRLVPNRALMSVVGTRLKKPETMMLIRAYVRGITHPMARFRFLRQLAGCARVPTDPAAA